MNGTNGMEKKQLQCMEEMLSQYINQPAIMPLKIPAQKQSVEIAKYSYSTQRGRKNAAKNKGFALSLHYIPDRPLEPTDKGHPFYEELDASLQELRNIYVRIDLDNKTVRQREHANHAFHYIPFGILDELFQLYNAISTSSLFDYYVKYKRGYPHNMPEELLAMYEQHFTDRSKKETFQHTHWEGRSKTGVPKPILFFCISYCPVNQKGEKSLVPWELRCETMRFRALTEEEVEEEKDKGHVNIPRAAFDENGCSKTLIRIPTEDLLTAIESIHYAVHQWLSGTSEL